MQVLGDLIRLPANEDRGLPLPWWHRAPLGLSNNTSVFVALTVASPLRPVPDLIVTVLNPSRWKSMYRLDCRKKDEPGVVAEVLETIPPLNVALAETVKLEKDDYHHVSLICEPAYIEQDTGEQIARIKRLLENRGFQVYPQPLPDLPELAWNRSGSVKHGWVTGVKWQSWIKKKFPAALHEVDLRKVVASADTEGRVLRYVFPRRGAMTLSIRHADEPGALAEITAAIKTCKLNILSSFLRRGGGGGVDAELVAVCEPSESITAEEIEALKNQIDELIGNIHQRFRAQLWRSDGKNAFDTIYIRHPEETVATAPRQLASAIRDSREELKEDIARKKADVKTDADIPIIPIFLSHRFTDKTNESGTVKSVKQALNENSCQVVRAESSAGKEPISIYLDVSSKLWTAQAGIFLIAKEIDRKHISINVAHELGFLMGQGKSVLMLVENVRPCVNVMNSFANIAGVLFERFEPTAERDDPRSIHVLIAAWIANVRKSLADR